MEALVVKIVVVIVAVIFWLSLVFIFERTARKQHAASGASDRKETSNAPSQPN